MKYKYATPEDLVAGFKAVRDANESLYGVASNHYRKTGAFARFVRTWINKPDWVKALVNRR